MQVSKNIYVLQDLALEERRAERARLVEIIQDGLEAFFGGAAGLNRKDLGEDEETASHVNAERQRGAEPATRT